MWHNIVARLAILISNLKFDLVLLISFDDESFFYARKSCFDGSRASI